jgi:hypothetical protein
MDTLNHFFTPTTARHARAEYALGFVVCMWLMIAHWSELDVWQAILLFAYIDLIGTVPGLVAYHLSPTGQIHRGYYYVYNVLHSCVTQGLVIIGYIGLFGWQWCILGIPTHIFIDRAMFNNYPKPFGVAFDPVEHPAFARFRREYTEFDADSANWKEIKKNTAALSAR